MGKGESKPPPPPDPVATAQAQGAANREAAIASQQMSMMGQRTPYGSLRYERGGETPEGTPQYTAIQELSPEQQRLYELGAGAQRQYGEIAQQQLGQARERLANPFQTDQFGAPPQINEATRQSTAQAMMGRLEPQLQQERERLETRLAAQGIPLGSKAYGSAIDEMGRRRTDLQLAAEQQALGQAAQLYGLEASARDKAINEALMQRQVPLNEIAALLSGSQVRGPQFVTTPGGGYQGGDIMGATYASHGAEMDRWQQEQANQAAMMQGLFGLGGALGGGYLMGRGMSGGGGGGGGGQAGGGGGWV